MDPAGEARVLNVYKRRGETPLACLMRLQGEYPELQRQTLTYAGRLDPLAEGVLVVLLGEEAERKDFYLHLRKRYRFDVLFGFATDTYDIAGKLTEVSKKRVQTVPLIAAVSEMTGKREEPYPPYSSRTVAGKPLFTWAREGRLQEIEIPRHTVEVYESMLRHRGTLKGGELLLFIERSMSLLRGDFRQKEIEECWRENIAHEYDTLYDVITIEISCGSGTYVRSLAHELGRRLGVPALALRIIRTAVGVYDIREALGAP